VQELESKFDLIIEVEGFNKEVYLEKCPVK
jgi:hypothetical protein